MRAGDALVAFAHNQVAQAAARCGPYADAHDRHVRAIRTQAQAGIVFDLMRLGHSSPDLLFVSLEEMDPDDREVFCRAIQKQIEQAKK